jgi:hypothetical protein
LGIKISELDEANALIENDYFAVVSEGETRKISFKVLQKLLAEAIKGQLEIPTITDTLLSNSSVNAPSVRAVNEALDEDCVQLFSGNKFVNSGELKESYKNFRFIVIKFGNLADSDKERQIQTIPTDLIIDDEKYCGNLTLPGYDRRMFIKFSDETKFEAISPMSDYCVREIYGLRRKINIETEEVI